MLLVASNCFFRTPSNLDRSLVFCCAHGRAANAVDGARNQDRLAGLDATRCGDELAARDRDERECGCLDQIKAIGDSRKDPGLTAHNSA